MPEKKTCNICGAVDIYSEYDHYNDSLFCTCPCCGRYELTTSEIVGANVSYIEGLASFFFYTGFKHRKGIDEHSEYRYYTSQSKEYCDEYNEKEDIKSKFHGRPVHYDSDIVKAWLPTSLSEKLDMILLKLNGISDHIGQTITLSEEELKALLFVKTRKNRYVEYTEEEVNEQLNFMTSFIDESGYVESYVSNGEIGDTHLINITTKGYERIDECELKNAHGKTVLVAMSFKKGTERLRESIREGISMAGFEPTFIDEVEHNEFITPELLSYIRRSRFVVVDLTHKNNGAYFEEGYAMGLGKPVIQLCKSNIKLHFDVAQKNTIMWDTEDDIPERLMNRIKATIG